MVDRKTNTDSWASVPELEALAAVVTKRDAAAAGSPEKLEESALTTEVPSVPVGEEKATSLYHPSVASILERLDEPEVVKDETATGMYMRVAVQLRDDATHLRSCDDTIEKPRALEAARVACEGAQQVIDGLETSVESEARAEAREELVKAYCNLKELLAQQETREEQEEQRQQGQELERKRAEAEVKEAQELSARKLADRRRRWVYVALVVLVGVAPIAVGLSWHFLGPALNVSHLDANELGSGVVVSGYVVGSPRGPVVVGVVGQRWQRLTREERIREVKLLMTTVSKPREQAVSELVFRNQLGELVARWVKGGTPRVAN